MAIVERAKREITKTVTVTDYEDVVRLDLSRREAETLAVILYHVGGSPLYSPRGDTIDIFDALVDIVGDPEQLDAYKLLAVKDFYHGLFFKDADSQ